MHDMKRSDNFGTGFRSVEVIAFTLHAKGPQFETGREHWISFSKLFRWVSVQEELNASKALRPIGINTVTKGKVDAEMKEQSLFDLNLTHNCDIPSLCGFLLRDTKDEILGNSA